MPASTLRQTSLPTWRPIPATRSTRATRWAAIVALIAPAALAILATVQGCRALPPPNGTALSSATEAPIIVDDPSSAVYPSSAQLPAPGPYLIHRVAAAPDAASTHVAAVSGTTDLAVRSVDGTLAATWRIPDGGRLRDVSGALSPDGRWLVYVTGDEPGWQLTAPMTMPLTLHVMDLADGREAFATRLLHEGIEGDLRAQAEDVILSYFDGTPTPSAASTALPSIPTPWQTGWGEEDVVCAFRSGLGVVAWSPAGTHLAFVGALDGPSGDVYVVDIDGWQVRRVSDEPTHAFRLAWSPDGQWILHEGSEWCKRAAGTAVAESTDVSSVDGATQRHVWGGSHTGSWLDAWPDAWLGDHEAIVHREANGCGICDIVGIDVRTGISRTLQDGMSATFVVDTQTSQIAVSGELYGSKQSGNAEWGTFLLSAVDASLERLSEQACRVDRWGAPERPFVRLEGRGVGGCDTAAFGAGVEDVPVGPFGRFPRTRVSEAGTWRVVFDDRGWTLFDPAGGAHADHTQGGITDVTFRPDEGGLFWGAGDELWYADAPDGEAQLIAPFTDGGGQRVDWAWWMGVGSRR